MAASNSEKRSSKSSDGDGSSLSPSRRQKSSPAFVAGGSSRWKYDVFLSLTSEDTRKNFTDHLYAALSQKGIITFRDDERLERGTEISSELTKAIEESRFSIVIFSKNYASSTWCLEELAKIVECMETNNHTGIPVFYDVEPSDVRKQKGEFEKAFDKHEQNLDYNKVQRWRAALAQVCNFSGWHLSYDRPEAQCIEDIVDDIWRRLNITFSKFSRDLVGMNSHLNKMNAYLEVGSDDVRFIGICGMGGIGKTTIARAVFEKISYQYEASCFLGNIREGYKRSGPVALQEQLLSQVTNEINLHISTVNEGKALISRRLGRKKVLVVLDDVDRLERLNELAGSHDWFGTMSRIIVTTRDEHVLISHAIKYKYKVSGLNHDDALQLFCMKAFKNKNPTDDHDNLSKRIVNYAYGIPLALEVLGSYLCDRSVEQWESALDSLQDYPEGNILDVLRLSYDGLNQNEKDIFLDIACFFKGKNKDRVIEILDYCDFYSTIGMKVLVDKSLITISYNKLDMHDLLQEMGWKIVREQHRDDCGQWSRLWLFEDVHQVFADNRGTHAVEGIMLNKPKQKILLLDGKSFSNMSNLRLLKISNVDVSKDLIYLSNELRFFKWHGYPLNSLPTNFEAHKLFELNLCHSRIRYLWKGVKAFPKLKTVKLSYSHNLIETPDFTMVPNLEMLDLEGCTRLYKVHDSVGLLKSLTVLNWKGCKNLESFPSNLSGLKSLKILNIEGCSKLVLPKKLEELECLEELDIGGTAITQIPSSIAQLSNLTRLSVGQVQSWRSFFWPRRYFDSILSGLLSLKTLDVSDCNLSEGALPRDLGSLCSLKELNLSNNNFVTLPYINQLHKLEILSLQNCQMLQSLPELPAGLNFLLAEDCPSLKDVSTALRDCTSPDIAFHLFNCLELPQNHGQENSLAVMLLKQNLQEKKSKIPLAHENMSKIRESISSGFLKPLEDMVSSPKVSDFFRRLKLNEKWLNGVKINLQSLGWILGDAESKAYVNKEVKAWLDKLNEVTYDLEDLLDEIVTEELSDHQDKPRNIKIQNQGIFSAELSLVEIVIKQRLEEITLKIENLQRQSETLGIRPKASRIKREPCQLTVDRDCFEDESHLIDRDEDKEAVIKLLLSDRTSIIAMVGECGVGKTTLAQLVYNDERVKKQFEFKAWIHVSDNFDDLLLTKAVLHAFTHRYSNIDNLDSLQTSLKEVLKGKKFLLVLDNFTLHSDGGKLQKFLTAGANGSRIIVTERHTKFEETMGTPAFTVRSLTKEESWMVFAKHAFPDKNSSLHPQLEYIGKLFVKNCRGLPLAAKVLGSVLRFKPVEEWIALLKDNILKMGMNPVNLFKTSYNDLPILKMSYNDLPIHLKRCVAYCSLFPTYHEYEEEKLILLWMAEGFLQQKEGTRMQEVGREYFRNLTYRSFFQPSGANKSCFIMHDLLKHLALFESRFICSRMDTGPLTSKTRHVLISGGRFRFEAICEAKFLRTLILYRSSWNKESYKLSVEQLNDLFEEQRRLRVLSLPRCDITIVPLSIGKLKYLRFLDLSYTAITELPNSVCSLHKLQTLLLSHCSVTKLPENMRELINLWHLDIRGTCLQEMPTDMDRLTSLQYLSDFFVGIDSGSKIKELGGLSNLRGTLHIPQLQNVESAGDASEASLKNKAYLQGLELEWSNVAVDCQNETGVLEQLEPHKNLEKLSIISYSGTRFPNWLGDSSFFKIMFLRLCNCNSCSHLPPLGQLPSLKELKIEQMNGVKMVGPEFYGMNSSSDKPFPSLEILVFREMLEWEEWISPEVEFPRLKKICISGCPRLAKCPYVFFPQSAEVAISECPLLVPVRDDLQLHDGNKMQFGSDDKVAGRPPICPVMEEIQLPDSYGVQLKHESEIASQSLEYRTDVPMTSHSSPPELSKLSTESTLPKLPVMVEKQVHEGNNRKEKLSTHEGNNRKEKLLDRPSTSRLSEVEELKLPDINVVQSTDVSITSNRPPPESPTRFTEDSSAKHVGASDYSSAATEFSSDTDTDTDDPNNDEGDKARFRRNEKLLDRPSTSRLQETEELQLPDSNVVQSTDVSVTSNRPTQESPTPLTEDSSAKHEGALDTYSAATEISSNTVTDDPIDDEGDKAQFRRNKKQLDRPSISRLQEIEELQLPDSNVVQSTEVLVTSNRPTPESPTPLTEDSSAKQVGALDISSAATEISSDTDTDTDDAINVSEISQLKRLPRKLYSLKIESCKALESLTEELMSVNLKQLYIMDCQYFKSIQASHLPFALKTLYIRRCKKLEFLSVEETTGKHTSVEHLCIESSCDPLKSFPLALFPKLRNLSICDCANFNSISITEDHNTLNSLEIRDCKNLESLWKSGLGTPKLTSILLSNCKKLKQLPGQLHGLTSLQSLLIKECPELDSIPKGGLPSSLNLLRISSCHKLTPCLQWGLHRLNKFIRFEIEGGCRDLESFPEQNLLPRNLNSLQFSRFPNIKVLNYEGLQHLTSLETLKINSCDKLQFLPEEGLPSSLSYLYISDCPLLKSKLQNRRGSEWYKIAHIPHIQIDGKVIS